MATALLGRQPRTWVAQPSSEDDAGAVRPVRPGSAGAHASEVKRLAVVAIQRHHEFEPVD